MLTDPALQNDADALGGAWKPLPNMIVGFRHLVRLKEESTNKTWTEALTAYNGSASYPPLIFVYEREWAKALGVQSVSP
jgi:hypothetical protein